MNQRRSNTKNHGQSIPAAMQYSAIMIGLCGAILVPIGLYFAFRRPRFLPEDERFTGAQLETIETVAPKMGTWLGLVFKVMSGYVVATGMLTTYIAATTFRRHELGSAVAIAVGGTSAIGTMSIVNVMLDSDFKKPLVGLSAIWALALLLHSRGR